MKVLDLSLVITLVLGVYTVFAAILIFKKRLNLLGNWKLLALVLGLGGLLLIMSEFLLLQKQGYAPLLSSMWGFNVSVTETAGKLLVGPPTASAGVDLLLVLLIFLLISSQCISRIL